MNQDFRPDELDVTERFARELDRIPGFRERTQTLQPTRRTSLLLVGAGLLLGLTLAVTRRRRNLKKFTAELEAA